MKLYNKKRIVTICCIMVSIMVMCAIQVSDYKSDSKITVTGYATWPFYTFESAVKNAATIVYGRVADKSDTLIHEAAGSDGSVQKEYYKEVTVDVLKILKGKEELEEITYLEMGGETDTHIYLMEGVISVNQGEEYIFFLNEYGAFMSPMTLIPVTDANVKLEGKIIPDSQVRKTENPYEMPVDDYLDEVYDLLNLEY